MMRQSDHTYNDKRSRESISQETKGLARRRARFVCKNPECETAGRLTLKQYAHIIPASSGGSADVNNILWLCESCHRKYEAEGKNSLVRDILIKKMEAFRDRPKVDNIVSGIFDELLARPDLPLIVELGNGTIRGADPTTIFTERHDSYRPSFLRFYRDDLSLRLSCHIKDRRGFTLLEIDDKTMHFHSKDIWDVERSARNFKIIDRTQEIWFEIKQSDDLVVHVSGALFLGGDYCTFDRTGLHTASGGRLDGFILDDIKGPNIALFGFGASPIPRPIGHANPNVGL